jgi:hypothetical protein
MAIGSFAAAEWLSDDQYPQYLRVIDDNYDHLLRKDHKWEEGPTSAKLIRNCKIEAFVNDSLGLHYAGSSFVKIKGVPIANLNCLLGEARINAMSVAVVARIDSTPTDCIDGWPTRSKDGVAIFGHCRGEKEPDPVYVSPSASKR